MFDPYWVCKDGRLMRAGEMHDSHLRNAIAMIERTRGRWRGKWLPRLYLELDIRRMNNLRRLMGGTPL